ncbi:MAG TPA: hypothetical protein VGM37_20495 [Armatimonadota bacterium]
MRRAERMEGRISRLLGQPDPSDLEPFDCGATDAAELAEIAGNEAVANRYTNMAVAALDALGLPHGGALPETPTRTYTTADRERDTFALAEMAVRFTLTAVGPWDEENDAVLGGWPYLVTTREDSALLAIEVLCELLANYKPGGTTPAHWVRRHFFDDLLTHRRSLRQDRQIDAHAAMVPLHLVCGEVASPNEEPIEKANTVARVHLALSVIKREEDRRLAWLVFAEGLSVPKAAVRVGVSAAAAKKRVQRDILPQLRAALRATDHKDVVSA